MSQEDMVLVSLQLGISQHTTSSLTLKSLLVRDCDLGSVRRPGNLALGHAWTCYIKEKTGVCEVNRRPAAGKRRTPIIVNRGNAC